MSDRHIYNSSDLRITLVTNACVLIESGEIAILTDPWFEKPWGFIHEPAMRVEELPKLTAIIGSHFAMDHWGIAALQDLSNKTHIPVLTATEGMAKKARKNGFDLAKCVEWGEELNLLPNFSIEVVEAQKWFGNRSNNYVLNIKGTRIFFGGETKELEPLRKYAASNPAIDIALAPSNGMRLLGFQLVTTAREGLEASRILRAQNFIPIHDSMHGMGFGGPTSKSTDIQNAELNETNIHFLKPGEMMCIEHDTRTDAAI